jgi:hypothetical protein
MPEPAVSRSNTAENARVLNNILLHLDCDAVDVFHLNEIQNLLMHDRSSKGRAYISVLKYCFTALRNGFHDRPTTSTMWSECTDPALMLDHLGGLISERKLRLFAVACCRNVPHLLNDEQSRTSVEVSERYADGLANAAELAIAESRARAAWHSQEDCDSPAACAAVTSAEEAARNAAWNAFCDRDGMGKEVNQSALLRCIAGNPFHFPKLDPTWVTPTVISAAQQMYESRDFSAMPVLGDALHEAGCEVAEILEHCRGRWPHVRGCWVVDQVLGKE